MIKDANFGLRMNQSPYRCWINPGVYSSVAGTTDPTYLKLYFTWTALCQGYQVNTLIYTGAKNP
ncbi:hypothetical protein SBDP2_760006 [Syntrophobacter sp. SbD2]|nr:hypothetical protein SBDP2_760006 [Syntrophobacter sp. SbD2]